MAANSFNGERLSEMARYVAEYRERELRAAASPPDVALACAGKDPPPTLPAATARGPVAYHHVL